MDSAKTLTLILAIAAFGVHTTTCFPLSAASAETSTRHKLLHLIEYQHLTDISSFQYSNVTELYVRACELSQTLYILQESLGTRSGFDPTVTLPYCVIPERAADDNINGVESIERLTEDVYMLANLTLYLERATDYEEEKHCGKNTPFLMQAQEMLNEIIAALVNMTGTHLSELSGTWPDSGASSASDALETSTSGESSDSLSGRCRGAMSDKYQFADVFELALAVWYTRNDLNYIRQQQNRN